MFPIVDAECFDQSICMILTLFDRCLLIFEDQHVLIRHNFLILSRIFVLSQAEHAERSSLPGSRWDIYGLVRTD